MAVELPFRQSRHMSQSLNSLKGDYRGNFQGNIKGVMKGDTRSLDYCSYIDRGSGFQVYLMQCDLPLPMRLRRRHARVRLSNPVNQTCELKS